jgi:hypothetical protein
VRTVRCNVGFVSAVVVVLLRLPRRSGPVCLFVALLCDGRRGTRRPRCASPAGSSGAASPSTCSTSHRNRGLRKPYHAYRISPLTARMRYPFSGYSYPSRAYQSPSCANAVPFFGYSYPYRAYQSPSCANAVPCGAVLRSLVPLIAAPSFRVVVFAPSDSFRIGQTVARCAPKPKPNPNRR